MNMKCISVDDEPRALEIIDDYIQRVPFLEAVGSFRSPLKAFEFMKRQHVDLVFLDINMPNLTGFELIRALTKKPLIILTTAYSEYAVESYELQVADYLLKPIEFVRFLQAANKALDLSSNGKLGHTSSEEVNKASVFVRNGHKLVRIELEDVLFVEASGNYQLIYMAGGKKVLSLIKMNALLETFGSSRFVRTHKSFAVNIDHIDTIENNRIRIGERIVPIGETYRNALYALLK